MTIVLYSRAFTCEERHEDAVRVVDPAFLLVMPSGIGVFLGRTMSMFSGGTSR